MGLTDELYVTMNSRGKPLTDFEHFKAEFKSKLDKIDSNLSNQIILKIDTVWTDLLWAYRDKNNLIDDSFLAYFGFLCDVILYRKGGTPQGKSRDPFDLLEEFFSDAAQENVAFMEKSFDCWCELAKCEKISDFFADRVSIGSRISRRTNQHAPDKIITYFDDADFFGDCLKSGQNFSLGKVVMLYAFLTYLLNAEKVMDIFTSSAPTSRNLGKIFSTKARWLKTLRKRKILWSNFYTARRISQTIICKKLSTIILPLASAILNTNGHIIS